jgi:hypothetical protein
MSVLKKVSNVFLCYSHRDQTIVHDLWSRLKKDGVDVWLDRENLLPGQDWQKTIWKTIRKSDVLIVCLSRNFSKPGGYRHEELRLAFERADLLADGEIFIIPVNLEECEMPRSLRHLHRVDLYKRGGYKKLLLVLKEK